MRLATDGVVPISDSQRLAWQRGELPKVEDLGGGLWSIPLEIPAGTIPATLSYALIDDDGVHLIDPGWGSDRNVELLSEALAHAGRALTDIATVIATHHHPDHLGLAPTLRAMSGARVVMSARERRVLSEVASSTVRDPNVYRQSLAAWGVPAERWDELVDSFSRSAIGVGVSPDLEVVDGDVLKLAGRRLEVVATPGHTGGHICLVDREARQLFTGDHVLPRIYSGVGIGILPGDEPMGDLLASLERLAEFDDFLVLPGHEFRFTGLGARREAIRAHHQRRSDEVAAVVAELGDSTVWEYARRLTWTAGWEGLSSFWLHSALRQTQMHVELFRRHRQSRLSRD